MSGSPRWAMTLALLCAGFVQACAGAPERGERTPRTPGEEETVVEPGPSPQQNEQTGESAPPTSEPPASSDEAEAAPSKQEARRPKYHPIHYGSLLFLVTHAPPSWGDTLEVKTCVDDRCNELSVRPKDLASGKFAPGQGPLSRVYVVRGDCPRDFAEICREMNLGELLREPPRGEPKVMASVVVDPQRGPQDITLSIENPRGDVLRSTEVQVDLKLMQEKGRCKRYPDISGMPRFACSMFLSF